MHASSDTSDPRPLAAEPLRDPTVSPWVLIFAILWFLTVAISLITILIG